MGECVIVYGKSGAGKSRSLCNFAADEIFLVNVEGKRLPFRKTFKNTIQPKAVASKGGVISFFELIKKGLERMPTNIAVIDDVGYLMTQMFMNGHRNLKGNEVFELYNDIADEMFKLIQYIKKSLPDDKFVYLLMHEDENDNGLVKLKTIGRLLDNQVCVEGMVTVCLRAMSDCGRHFFRTVTDGRDITKSPEEMFEADEIDNDLKAVDTAIRKYYFTEVKK